MLSSVGSESSQFSATRALLFTESASPTAPAGAGAQADSLAYLYPETEHVDLGVTATSQATDSDFDRRGIESVTLDVSPGTTVALVGPTGSGKSTIAQLLVRLFDPDTGDIRLDGHGLIDLERDALADSVGLVFQETFLFNDSVFNNITLGQIYEDAEVVAAAEMAKAHTFIDKLDDGYRTVVGERGATLSGGQRQRIALARALIRQPRLLVLDDATSAVDPAVEGEILAGLDELPNQRGHCRLSTLLNRSRRRSHVCRRWSGH